MSENPNPRAARDALVAFWRTWPDPWSPNFKTRLQELETAADAEEFAERRAQQGQDA